MSIYSRALSTTCAVALIVGAAPAVAQTSTDAPPATSSSSGPGPEAQSTALSAGQTGEDIVVTARRREESIQNVPVAITAFSQRALEQKGISGAFDLNKAVPGLQVNADSGNSSLPSFSIRGRGQFFGAASGSVETYFADVPLSAPFQIPTLPPQFFDLQSVQVLKGPQGTLFGRNTTGGAVLFVPAAPTDEFGGYARLQGGNSDDVQLEGAINVPLSEKAAVRVAGFYWHRKGYSRTVGGETDPYGRVLRSQRYDNQDVGEVRATLLLKPTDQLTNSTIFTYHTDQNRSTTQVNLVNTTTPTFYGPATIAFYPDYATDGPRVVRMNVDLHRDPSSTFAVVNTTTFEASDSFTVKNIFGYIDARGYGNNPGSADGSNLPAVDLPAPPRQERNHQYTDELQFQGRLFDDKLNYIFGGLIDLTRQPGGDNEINIVTNSYPAGALQTQFDEQFRQSRFTSKSVFGSLTFKPVPALSITAGIRHTWDDISERSCEYNPGTPTAPLPTDPSAAACSVFTHPDGSVGFIAGSKSFRGFSYNAGLEYHPADGTMLYGGYRRGYKRGGFNAKGTGLSLFGPEKVDDYYIGVKQDLNVFGIPGHFNVEGFYDVYKGAQRSYLTFDLAAQALSTVVTNAPKQTYRGFDLDFVLDPAPWLELSGNYTFVDAFFGTFPDDTCNFAFPGAPGPYCFNLAAARGGSPFPFVLNSVIQSINPGDQGSNPPGLVSRNKLSASARFHTELNDGSEIAFAPTISYQSKFFFNDTAFRIPNSGAAIFGPTNSATAGADTAPGYTLVDLRLEWNKVRGSNFDIAANVNNLFDKTFITGGSGIYQLGFNSVTYGAPRFVTAEVRFHF